MDLTPRQTVCKSTLAGNTLSMLVSVSPGSICISEVYCRQSNVYEYHNIILSYFTAVTVNTFAIWQAAIMRIFRMCLLTKLWKLLDVLALLSVLYGLCLFFFLYLFLFFLLVSWQVHSCCWAPSRLDATTVLHPHPLNRNSYPRPPTHSQGKVHKSCNIIILLSFTPVWVTFVNIYFLCHSTSSCLLAPTWEMI